MKNLVTKLAMGFAIIGFSFAAFAAVEAGPQASEPPPTPLAQAMRVMAGNLKTISEQVQNKAMNAQSAVLADQFVAAITKARTFFPKSIEGLAGQDQADAKALYLKMIDQTTDLGQQLAASLRANDNAKAVDILNQIVSAKKKGHTEFKQ